MKDDVGKAKPFTHTLPSENFAFGKGSVFCESAGAGKLITTNNSKAEFPRIPNSDSMILTFFYFSVIDNYQYRVDDPKAEKARNPDIKDFKKLNKVVLAEGATNSMVSFY